MRSGGNVDPTGALIRDKNEIKPGADPGKAALLRIDGLEVPVELSIVEEKPSDIVIKLWAHGELFEEERYSNPAGAFGLVNAAGETYEPPIPLLKFPMHVGDKLKWDGKMLTGPVGRNASARVTSSEDKLEVGADRVRALLVEVELKISGGGPNPALRRLSFWFVPGKGLLRREFGVSTTREPPPAVAVPAQ